MVLGTMFAIGGVIVSVLALFVAALGGGRLGAAGFAILIFSFVFWLGQAFIYPGLGKGMYSAWVAVQIVWGVAIPWSLASFFLSPAALRNDPLLGAVRPLLVVMPIVYALLWVYLYKEPVRTFCSVGRRISARG